MSKARLAVTVATVAAAVACLVPVAARAGTHVEYGNDESARLIVTIWLRALFHLLGL
jgi:hypothetical protein